MESIFEYRIAKVIHGDETGFHYRLVKVTFQHGEYTLSPIDVADDLTWMMKDVESVIDQAAMLGAAKDLPVLKIVNGKVTEFKAPMNLDEKLDYFCAEIPKVLAKLRSDRGLSEWDMGRLMGTNASIVQMIEDTRREDVPLVGYLHALGGDLEIRIILPGQEDIALTTAIKDDDV